MSHPFFLNKGPISLVKVYGLLKITNQKKNDFNFYDIKDLQSANKNSVTFFHSKKYKEVAKSTKASFCLTSDLLKDFLPTTCEPIIVNNILTAVARITEEFYPYSVEDEFDNKVFNIENLDYNNVFHGKNVLIGENVRIGANCLIGHNTIIEKNVHIGDNCKIGSNTIIRNSIIRNNVSILDNCTIGKKGFGFFPNKKKNFRYPHIGIVIIDEGCEIGCGATIDRGSMSNTEIGKNTFLDNQIHIAHNVKIGENTIIAGQVGIAGSSTIGDNVRIGGQAGISGHLKIGNNVDIAGGSGVIKDIPDNSRVMGYPAKNLREFLRENK